MNSHPTPFTKNILTKDFSMKDKPVPDHHYFTKAEVEALQLQLHELKTKKLNKLNEGWRLAVAEGDDRETDALTIASNLLFNHHHDVKDLKEILENYTLIKSSKKQSVQIGSQVTLAMNGRMLAYTLCDPVFADAMKSKISYKSPLGSAILNKKIGKHTITINSMQTEVEITEIVNKFQEK